MSHQEILVYEQEHIHKDCGDEPSVNGKLRIIEKNDIPVIEWKAVDDDNCSESDWAVITPPRVSFSNASSSDSVILNTCKKTSGFSCELIFLQQFKVTRNNSLKLMHKNGTNYPMLVALEGDFDFFIEVIQRYVALSRSSMDASVYVVQTQDQAGNDFQLSALNLVPPRKGISYLGGHWATTPKTVLGFLNNMKNDPYTTTLSTFSKVYDVLLNGTMEGYSSQEVPDIDVAQFLNSISGMEDLEGYEVLTKRENLAEKLPIQRLPPLTLEEFRLFMDGEGRIIDVQLLKERIFKGGISSSLRREVWCYLLGYFLWNETPAEKEKRQKVKEHEYYVMKEQWKTFSEQQENNFTGYRERKSLIEKDVNRTDRQHPFYEKENNPNVDLLNDILMTYIMFNFDLGYVQGMSDLLAPILYVMEDEATAFWCFVGFMNIVYRNFELDQSGMKEQLQNLNHLLRVIDPEFMSYLESRDSSNLYFCFRWLLVWFKREWSYSDTLRLWEVLWTGLPCPNFHLLIAAAMLDSGRDEIMDQGLGFTEILKHVNEMSQKIELEHVLKESEAIYKQLAATPSLPDTIKTIIGLPTSTEVKDWDFLS